MQIAAVKNYEQKKHTATSGKLIKLVYASYVYVYTFLYNLVTWYYWSIEIKETGVGRAYDVHERMLEKYMQDISPKAWKVERIK